jgi:GTPase
VFIFNGAAMSFIDESWIEIKAGDGGAGCLSFRRERCIPKGGPDGGDGGKGGDVWFRVNPNINTLRTFVYKRHFKAKKGRNGSGSNRAGFGGEDLWMEVPLGTSIYDVTDLARDDPGDLVRDLTDPNETFCVARGGRGGQGNVRFKTATCRAPRKTTAGEPGEMGRFRLSLKVMADVGLLGLPNAGKSSLIRAVSAATPKVAAYPFTTKQPHLAMVFCYDSAFVMADIPGLIEGAAEGVGLGHRFLKHVSRCPVLLHVMDAEHDQDVLWAHYQTIESEIKAYDPSLCDRVRMIVLNKADLLGDELMQEQVAFLKAKTGKDVVGISAITASGTQGLCEAVYRLLHPNPS